MVLRVRGSTGSLGKLTLQRDCGVSWRYRAIALIDPVRVLSAIGECVAKKTHFDCNRSIDRKCQLVYKFIHRGWLNAVAWEYVPKILGRETEVTS